MTPFKEKVLEYTPAIDGALILSDSIFLKSSQTSAGEIEIYNCLHNEIPSLKWVKTYSDPSGGFALLFFDSFPEAKFALEQLWYLVWGNLICLQNSKISFADPKIDFNSLFNISKASGIEIKGISSFLHLPKFQETLNHSSVFQNFLDKSSIWFYNEW